MWDRKFKVQGVKKFKVESTSERGAAAHMLDGLRRSLAGFALGILKFDSRVQVGFLGARRSVPRATASQYLAEYLPRTPLLKS